MADLEENLKDMGKSLTDLPIVIQYNKRDMPDAMTVEELQKAVNVHGFPHFEAVANKGDGVFPTLKDLAGRVLESVNSGGLVNTRAKVSAPRPAAAATAEGETAQAGATVATPRAGNRPLGGASGARPGAAGSPRTAAAPAASAAGVATASRPGSGPSSRPSSPLPSRPGGGAGSGRPDSGPGAGRPSSPPPPHLNGTARPTLSTAPSTAPAASYSGGRSMADRVVPMQGLATGRNRSKIVVLAVLGALIAGAAWFVLSRM
jgi:hypothetical protein